MTIIEKIEKRTSAMRVGDLAALLEVTPQHIYSLIARGLMPVLRVEGAIRLDPQEVAAWLRGSRGKLGRAARSRAA